MLRVGVLAVVAAATMWAQRPDVPDVSIRPTVTSAANASIGVAPGSLATVKGFHLAVDEAVTDASPWPTNLGGVRVDVAGANGLTRPAGLEYVSPSQINLEIPTGLAAGAATMTVRPATQKPIAFQIKIQPVAPALYSVDASGAAAATATRVLTQSLIASDVSTYSCQFGQSCTLVPIEVGPDSTVYVTLRATGLDDMETRDVRVNLGSVQVMPDFAGPDPVKHGDDDVRFAIPFSMRGAGEVPVSITAGGVASNTVKLQIR